MKSILVIILIVILGGWLLLKGVPASAPVTDTTVTNQMPVIGSTTPETSVENTPSIATILYTDQGFSPKNLTVLVGTNVTFVDQASGDMWVASDPHPTHQGYDGMTKSQHCEVGYTGVVPFDQCTAGTSYSFTFSKAGTWGYHNHGSAGDKGTIIVTAGN